MMNTGIHEDSRVCTALIIQSKTGGVYVYNLSIIIFIFDSHL